MRAPYKIFMRTRAAKNWRRPDDLLPPSVVLLPPDLQSDPGGSGGSTGTGTGPTGRDTGELECLAGAAADTGRDDVFVLVLVLAEEEAGLEGIF